MGAVEIARQQPRRGARRPADQFEVALGHAREVIVDDHGGDRGDQTERGRKQRLGDAGRDDGKIRRLRFRDADKAVHDAPDRAEQADEGRRRADGGEQSHAEPDPARFGAHDFGKARCRAFLDAGVAGNSRRQPRLAHCRGEQRRQHAALGAERELRFRQRPRVADLAERGTQLALNDRQFDHLGDEDGPGHQRGKGKADHDGLDQHVRRLEHRPWRQFARTTAAAFSGWLPLGRGRGASGPAGRQRPRYGGRRQVSLNGSGGRRGRRLRRQRAGGAAGAAGSRSSAGPRRRRQRQHRQRGDHGDGRANDKEIFILRPSSG